MSAGDECISRHVQRACGIGGLGAVVLLAMAVHTSCPTPRRDVTVLSSARSTSLVYRVEYERRLAGDKPSSMMFEYPAPNGEPLGVIFAYDTDGILRTIEEAVIVSGHPGVTVDDLAALPRQSWYHLVAPDVPAKRYQTVNTVNMTPDERALLDALAALPHDPRPGSALGPSLRFPPCSGD